MPYDPHPPLNAGLNTSQIKPTFLRYINFHTKKTYKIQSHSGGISLNTSVKSIPSFLRTSQEAVNTPIAKT